jgi:hypothetical protein
MNSGRGRAALVIAAIVVGSALAGAALDRLVVSRAPRHGRPPGSQSTPEQDAKRRQEILDRMTRDLDLSAAQRVGIDSVMQRADSALRVVRGEMQPRLRQIFDASRAEITSRLDSAQRVKYAKLRPARRR